jgi:GT2 family glycosyltransferase
MAAPRLSAVIVNYEGGELLLSCLESLAEQDLPLQVILVDNGSADRSAAVAAARFPELEVVRPGANVGFAGGANAGAARARGDALLFLNPDLVLEPGCAAALLTELEDPRAGIVGPALRVGASELVEYGATVDPVGFPMGLTSARPPLYVPGCALAVRRELFEQLGGFDERFFLFAEDVDLCWRALLAGWDVRIARDAVAAHVGGASAPGGYASGRALETTRLRVALRERNTLAMLLKCYGSAAAGVVLPLYVAQALTTAALLAATGRVGTARDVLDGLLWNVRELRTTLRLRRQAQALRAASDRAVLRRMHHGLGKGLLLLRLGLPRVLER